MLQKDQRVRVSSDNAPNTNGLTGTVLRDTTGDWGWLVPVALDGMYGPTWYTPDELAPLTKEGWTR